MKRIVLPADPRANYLAHQAEIDQAIGRVLRSGSYILGPEVAAFEEEFAAYVGALKAVGVGSGTDALEIALRACGLGPGDAVITLSHTAVATVVAIERAGSLPVLVDIDPQTFTMDTNRLEDTVKKFERDRKLQIKGIVPVHLYGHPADMPAIYEIAKRYRLFVIEDCAQSHGAAIQGRKAGTWGHISVFSFYPTKNMGALGDGGAVLINEQEFAGKALLLREYGWRKQHISEIPGMNSRLDEIHAAILRVKLKYLDQENARRRGLARIYDTLLAETSLLLPYVAKDTDHVYHQYVIRARDRDGLRVYLKENGIATLVHYPVPIHLQPAYKDRLVIGQGGLEHSERACREILSLPMHPRLSDEEVRRVSDLIIHWDKHAPG